MMRDIFDLDMMPFYNCYCGEVISDVDFKSSGEVLAKNVNPFYKILSVPVRFGKTYTISINSELPVEMISVIYGKKGLIKNKTDNLNNIKDSENKQSTYKCFQKTAFSRPITYTTKSWHQLYDAYTRGIYGKLQDIDEGDFTQVMLNSEYDQGLGQFEKYLRLLIKVPANNQSSVVVIEGDYSLNQNKKSSNTNSVTFTNQSIFDMTINSKVVSGDWVRPEIIRQKYKDETYKIVNDTEEKILPMISPLGLLQLSDGNVYAFSNRLIEYLLQNVINPLEQFDKNIYRVQKYISSVQHGMSNGSRYQGNYVEGVWDNDMQKYLFDLCKDNKYVKQRVDINGFVDKDTEQVITRGQGV